MELGIDPVLLLGWTYPLTHRQFEVLASFADGSWSKDSQESLQGRDNATQAREMTPEEQGRLSKSNWLARVPGATEQVVKRSSEEGQKLLAARQKALDLIDKVRLRNK